MTGAEAALWISAALLLQAYVGHPLAMALAAILRRRPVRREDITPSVTVIVAAYNEQERIADKIENILALDYPKDKLEVIVVSDGSTDRTEEIAGSYEREGVKVLSLPERGGKTAAQNAAAAAAKGEILFFTDVSTPSPPDALKKLVRAFADESVGCVSGRVTYRRDETTATEMGMGLYGRYQQFIRRRQADAGTLIGGTGCILAVRKDLYVPLPPHYVSDLMEPVEVLLRGHRTVFEPEATALVDRPTGLRDEFRRRVRIVTQAFAVLGSLLRLLRRPGWAFMLMSGRILRWIAPLLLLIMLGASIALYGRQPYTLLLWLQVCFYGLALVGLALEASGKRVKLLYLPYFFCMLNAAALVGMIKALRGEKATTWKTASQRYEEG